MEISYFKNVPDSTYFRVGEAEPEIQDGKLYLIHGRGTRRSWGSPQVTSTIVLNDNDLTSVHVGFSHKHGGSQFWRHYKKGERKVWRQLTEEDKLRIIDAYKENAPGWANVPGKLKVECLPNCKKTEYDSAGNIIAYKYLKLLADGNFMSPARAGNRAIWNDGLL